MSPFPLKKLFPSAPDFTAFSIKPNNKTLSPHGLNRGEKPFHLQQTHVHVFRLTGTDRVYLVSRFERGMPSPSAYPIPGFPVPDGRRCGVVGSGASGWPTWRLFGA
jgi:hypothetical protein